MKLKLLVLSVLCALAIPSIGQENPSTRTLFEQISGIQKKTDKFNLILHLHGTLDATLTGSDFEQCAFQMKQLRIEAKGNINEWLSYNWRQRLNKSNTPAALDNLPTSIDNAWLRATVMDGGTITFGKQGAAYGGFEYDLDPIEIYQYSDMCDYMLFDFMTGITFAYNITPSQQVQFQVLNSRCNSTEEIYGILPEGIGESKVPLAYTLNWNGSFFQDMLRTRWSFSILSEAESNYNYFYALGNQFVMDKFNIYLDFYLSNEELDNRGIGTDMCAIEGTPRACSQYVRYESWVTKLNYAFAPKWNLFAKGMYENAYIYKKVKDIPRGKYRTAYGYFGGVEYYPMENGNLRLYLAYLGRSYRFPCKGETLGFDDHSTTRISLGLIYHIPMF